MILLFDLFLLNLACSYSYVCGCSNNPYIEDAGPLVITTAGSMIGKYVSDSKVAAFLGIPYAEPPIDDNRFQKPKPLDHWEGILNATNKPPPCMQFSTKNFSWIPDATPSENCLFLNIWAPSKCTTPGALPVMVFIHGGGFYAGSSEMDIYDGSTIASQAKMIVVSMNYRVGVFGFLKAGTENAPGNMGLLDQNLALKWIKKNVEYFGGDPKRITLFGESAGAISIGLHMLSPLSRNLFSRAILQSNSALNTQLIDNSEVAYFKSNMYSKLAGCADENSTIQTDPDVIECLKKKDALELAKIESIITSTNLVFFLPSYHDEFLPLSPVKSISDGHLAQIDVLLGNNLNESNIFLSYLFPDIFQCDREPSINLTTAQGIVSGLCANFPNPTAPEIFQQYFQNLTEDDSVEIVKSLAHIYSDYVFNCPVKFFAERLMKAYMYWYTHKSDLGQHAEWLGVTHFDEVSFVFGIPGHNTNKYTPEDKKFSEDLIQIWTNFAKTGYPLGDKYEEDWPVFTAEQPLAYELNSKSKGVLPYPPTTDCEFWRPHLMPKTC